MTTSPYIHPVPVGATIPAGTKYAAVMDRNHDFQQGAGEDSPRFTADPIPAPRPTPPTEPGTVLVDVTDDSGETWDHVYHVPAYPDDKIGWKAVDLSDVERQAWLGTDRLMSWTVADVVPRKADPLDENDHRDRIVVGRTTDRRLPLVRHGRKDWRTPGVTSGDPLKDWHGRYGWDVRFADEANQS